MRYIITIAAIVGLFSCKSKQLQYDTIIRNGMVYDGSGNNPVKTDIGIINDSTD